MDKERKENIIAILQGIVPSRISLMQHLTMKSMLEDNNTYYGLRALWLLLEDEQDRAVILEYLKELGSGYIASKGYMEQFEYNIFYVTDYAIDGYYTNLYYRFLKWKEKP